MTPPLSTAGAPRRTGPGERRASVFVVGPDEFNMAHLRRIDRAERYRFEPLLEHSEIVAAPRFDMPALLEKARNELRRASDGVDAIVGYWDFPTTLMLPILRAEHGLRGPSLESVLRCEHKYWSRLVQKEAAPEHVPRFALVDPFDDAAAARTGLGFPFWIKPVKAHSSKLGFVVRNRRQLAEALARIRAGIDLFAEPFDHILEHAELPGPIAGIGGRYCIAEEMIWTGRQCTLEGYVFDGDVEIYGVVGSIRGRNRTSFERYQYPYEPPASIRERMTRIAADVISRTGLDDSPFNVEFFYSRSKGTLHLLEINARISKSHAPLFEKVEGAANHQVMVEVALGHRPEYPEHAGRCSIAGKFMLRYYGDDDDALVTEVPTAEQIRSVQQRISDVEIQPLVSAGMRLGDAYHQDSYSYELAELFIGAASERELMRKYRDCVAGLPFAISSGREPARAAASR